MGNSPSLNDTEHDGLIFNLFTQKDVNKFYSAKRNSNSKSKRSFSNFLTSSSPVSPRNQSQKLEKFGPDSGELRKNRNKKKTN
jgi:hypothetical protein